MDTEEVAAAAAEVVSIITQIQCTSIEPLHVISNNVTF